MYMQDIGAHLMNQYTFNQYFSPAHSLIRGRKPVLVAQLILARDLFAVLSVQEFKMCFPSQTRQHWGNVIHRTRALTCSTSLLDPYWGMCYGHSQLQHGSLVPRASPGMGTRLVTCLGAFPGLLRLPRLDSFWGWWPCPTSVFSWNSIYLDTLYRWKVVKLKSSKNCQK